VKNIFETKSIVVQLLRAGQMRFDSRQGPEIFLLGAASRPVLGPTQHPVQGLGFL
jgi:hypothetical protein